MLQSASSYEAPALLVIDVSRLQSLLKLLPLYLPCASFERE